MKQRILKLKNTYIGKKVLYIGTGSSVLDLPLNNISNDVYTFGINRFLPFYKEYWKDFKLDFHLVHDPTVLHMSFYNQFDLRRKNGEHDEEYDLENEVVKKYKDVSTADYIVNNKVYENTKILFSHDIKTSHAERFNLIDNSQWIDANKLLMDTNDNFVSYAIDKNVSTFGTPIEQEDQLLLKLWAKNTFCNTALPLLFYLGFSEIYLAGVDYSADGYFFCKCKSHNGYVTREFDEREQLIEYSKEVLEHKPQIIVIKNKNDMVSLLKE